MVNTMLTYLLCSDETESRVGPVSENNIEQDEYNSIALVDQLGSSKLCLICSNTKPMTFD
jgi:hypothetical protein